jgi:hypothetical protein
MTILIGHLVLPIMRSKPTIGRLTQQLVAFGDPPADANVGNPGNVPKTREPPPPGGSLYVDPVPPEGALYVDLSTPGGALYVDPATMGWLIF